ncbi:hybrid sensor histidine kinase/response regulator [Paraliomyxa miuraensis]|uniref:hybrid sensor histidine kinase/response regulator n=1 Tax=Paraliomyxa miuraensis TaxID=376150 RepID=UPI0022500BA7|nr:hybrid sensor histidine kinase/response regulator [Paraliomyxa miuraensis]MCX4241413.1 hybrid sensor histidine kinase/response regulator [Paraliomyxa miuraensis]
MAGTLGLPEHEDLHGSILMVDDVPTNLKVLAKVLTRAGHRVRPALDGTAALESALALLPDLVLLDVNMPGMNGYEVCAAFKLDPRLCDIPIIFISAADEKLDKIKAFSAGAVDYVTKPFDADEVLARVRTHLALSYARKEQEAFGRMVAHEISNPLTQIILQVDAGLMTGGLPMEDMVRVKASADRIHTIVRSMLTLSKLHKQEVESEPLDMRVLIQRSRQILQHVLATSSAHIEVPDDMPRALGYGPWVEQIWINYITNAIKYGGRPPRIVIDWKRSEDDMIQYMVRDNGRGLAPEEQAVVFNEFTRLGHIKTDGHGLGLAIVKRVVSRMQGSVGLESTPGEGSTFYFCLPAA